MNFELYFLPQVEQDVTSAMAWYNEKASNLGSEFRRTFLAQAAEVGRSPKQYRRVHGKFRRALLRRFPYAMYFQQEEQRVVVFGVFHTARDPLWVNANLKERSPFDRDENTST